MPPLKIILSTVLSPPFGSFCLLFSRAFAALIRLTRLGLPFYFKFLLDLSNLTTPDCGVFGRRFLKWVKGGEAVIALVILLVYFVFWSPHSVKIIPTRPSHPRRNEFEIDIVHTLNQGPKILFLQIIRTGPPTYNKFWLRKPGTERPTPFDKRVIYQHNLTPFYYKPIPPVFIKAGNKTLLGWEETMIKDGTVIQALASHDLLVTTSLPAIPIVLINFDLAEHKQLLEDLSEKNASLAVAAATKYQAEIKACEERRALLEDDVARLLPFEVQSSNNLAALAALKKSQETLIKSKEGYKTRGDAYKARAETAETNIKTKENELAVAKKQLAEAAAEITKLSGHRCPRQADRLAYDKLDADYKALDVRCKRYKRERDDVDREMSSLRGLEDRLRSQVASLQRQLPPRFEDKRQRMDQPTPAPATAPVASATSETWNQLEKARAELAKEKERNEKIFATMDNFKESLKSEIAIGIREQVLKSQPPYGAFPQRPYY